MLFSIIRQLRPQRIAFLNRRTLRLHKLDKGTMDQQMLPGLHRLPFGRGEFISE